MNNNIDKQILDLVHEHTENTLDSFVMFAMKKHSNLDCLLQIYQEFKSGVKKTSSSGNKNLDSEKCQYVFTRGEKSNQQCNVSVKKGELFCSKHRKSKTVQSVLKDEEKESFILDLSDEDSWNVESDEKEESENDFEEDE